MTFHLVTDCVIAQTSASWKPSVPSSSLRTCPVIATSGTLSISASSRPVTRFVAPGPEVAQQTPTRPLVRAKPLAANAAAASWRTRT